MSAQRFAISVFLASMLSAFLLGTGVSLAGTYYIYACSSYGNTAPAFTPWSDADHLSTANACMQPAPAGGYRSLEINNSSSAPVLKGYGAHWIANSPSSAISIVGAYTPVNTVLTDCNLHMDGFSAQYFWGGGSQEIDYINDCNTNQGYGFGTGISRSFGPSSYFGWGATCSLKSSCWTSSGVGAVLGVLGVRLTAQEDSGPWIIADGSNNLWYQGGHWVRGGGWPVGITVSDPSGVCATDLLVNGQFTSLDDTNDTSPNTSSFTQCWPTDSVAGTLNTTSYANGPLALLLAARNAANVGSTPSETLQVDNTPVTLSLATPDDPDPNVWVDHAVQVRASASAGPSGLGGTNCSTNSGASYPYPANGITLNGTGIWKVSCSSWNNAVDVNGHPASSPTQGVTVRIDETPPAVAFEPVNPSDPQTVVANTSDGQSGIASGEIQMRPANGGSWNTLATRFDGSRLLARFDDASLSPGRWEIQAISCDNAGNCSSTQETLTLPLRSSSASSIGFGRFKDPARPCKQQRARRHRRHRSVCHRPELVRKRTQRVRFGHRAVLHGLLTTAQGVPIAGAPVVILTAPSNGLSQYRQAGSVRTNARGAWTTVLLPGPSRRISAIYNGSPTVQPSEGRAKLIVPASVRVVRVWPRHIPWGGRVHIKARLLGGFLPAQGALVRLRLGYGNAKITYGVQEHVDGNGTFEVTNAFGSGPSGLIRHYWLQECTLPQGDYPFAPACGSRSAVTVGGI